MYATYATVAPCYTGGIICLSRRRVQVANEGLASELAEDADTEEALKEFDFLVTAEDGEGAGEARSSGDGTEWGEG